MCGMCAWRHGEHQTAMAMAHSDGAWWRIRLIQAHWLPGCRTWAAASPTMLHHPASPTMLHHPVHHSLFAAVERRTSKHTASIFLMKPHPSSKKRLVLVYVSSLHTYKPLLAHWGQSS